MKNQLKLLVAASTLVIFTSPAIAGTPGLNDRQANQRDRIAQGIESGELTRKETRRLVQGQAELQRMENRAKSDGIVTKKERARLHNKANQESAKIAHNKHDRQQRPNAQ